MAVFRSCGKRCVDDVRGSRQEDVKIFKKNHGGIGIEFTRLGRLIIFTTNSSVTGSKTIKGFPSKEVSGQLLFVDGELRFEPSSLRLPTLLFQFTELLRDTAEPGRRLPRTCCTTADRGVLVKERTEMVIVVTDRTGL